MFLLKKSEPRTKRMKIFKARNEEETHTGGAHDGACLRPGCWAQVVGGFAIRGLGIFSSVCTKLLIRF